MGSHVVELYDNTQSISDVLKCLTQFKLQFFSLPKLVN